MLMIARGWLHGVHRVWDVRTLTQVEERRVKGAVTSLAFTGGNDRLLSLTYADHVQFLDPSTYVMMQRDGSSTRRSNDAERMVLLRATAG